MLESIGYPNLSSLAETLRGIGICKGKGAVYIRRKTAGQKTVTAVKGKEAEWRVNSIPEIGSRD